MLLTVLLLCLVTLSKGGRAAPPPLTGPTVGDLMQKSQYTRSGPFVPSASSPQNPKPGDRRHPMSISIGGGGISIVDRREPQAGDAAPSGSREKGVDGSPTFAASPPPTPEATPSVAISPEASPSQVAPSPSPDPLVSSSPEPAAPAGPEPVASASPWDPNAQGGGNSSAFISKLQQMVIMLFLIGFLAFACLKAMSRYLPGMAPSGKRMKQLEVLERQSLAQGASVSLVRIGKKYLVVGQTEQNINTLCELSSDQLEPPAAEPAADKPVGAPVASMSFHGDILRHYLSIFPGFGPGSKGGA